MEDKERINPMYEIGKLEGQLQNMLEENPILKELVVKNKQLQQKIDKAKEYITSYESISTIQGLKNSGQNKDLDDKTMIEMTNRYLEVHDKILEILE